jgi:hypothetical protein
MMGLPMRGKDARIVGHAAARRLGRIVRFLVETCGSFAPRGDVSLARRTRIG